MGFTTLGGINVENNKVAIFGAGNYGKKCLWFLKKHGVKVECFIDNDVFKRGKTIDDIRVVTLDFNDSIWKNVLVVIAVKDGIQSISNQLLNAGISKKQIIYYSDLLIEEEKRILKKCEKDVARITPLHLEEGKIKVLYDGQPYAFQKRGGISRYFYEIICRGMEDDRFYIDFFQGIHQSEVCFPLFIEEKISRHEWNTPEIQFLKKERIEELNGTLIRKYCSQEDTFDIYHPTYYYDSGVTSYKKMIVTVHDMIHEIFNLDERTKEQKKRIIEKADGIIAVSENTKKDLINILRVEEKKIRVIYEANSLLASEDSRPLVDEQYILYVGAREKYKNFTTLLMAFADSSFNKDLKIVCFGGGEIRKEEEKLIDELKLSDKIIHMSGDDKVLSNLYKFAELFVYPSAYEGFGLPLLEAMHCGCPVLTADISSMPEIAGDAAEYFEPNSSESLRFMMDQLLSDNYKRIKMKELGRRREAMFSWDRCVDEIHSFYMDVLCENPG